MIKKIYTHFQNFIFVSTDSTISMFFMQGDVKDLVEIRNCYYPSELPNVKIEKVLFINHSKKQVYVKENYPVAKSEYQSINEWVLSINPEDFCYACWNYECGYLERVSEPFESVIPMEYAEGIQNHLLRENELWRAEIVEIPNENSFVEYIKETTPTV